MAEEEEQNSRPTDAGRDIHSCPGPGPGPLPRRGTTLMVVEEGTFLPSGSAPLRGGIRCDGSLYPLCPPSLLPPSAPALPTSFPSHRRSRSLSSSFSFPSSSSSTQPRPSRHRHSGPFRSFVRRFLNRLYADALFWLPAFAFGTFDSFSPLSSSPRSDHNHNHSPIHPSVSIMCFYSIQGLFSSFLALFLLLSTLYSSPCSGGWGMMGIREGCVKVMGGVRREEPP